MRLAYDSRSVRDTLKGFKKLYAEKSPEGAQIKVPWSVNLANESKRILVSKEAVLAQLQGLDEDLQELAIRRLHIAMLFGIFFLLRKSEFLDETPVREGTTGVRRRYRLSERSCAFKDQNEHRTAQIRCFLR